MDHIRFFGNEPLSVSDPKSNIVVFRIEMWSPNNAKIKLKPKGMIY